MKKTQKPAVVRKRASRMGAALFIWLLVAAGLGAAAFLTPPQTVRLWTEKWLSVRNSLAGVTLNNVTGNKTDSASGGALQSAAPLPPEGVELTNPQAGVKTVEFRRHGVPVTMIEGGIAGTRRSPLRQGVVDFVEQSGAAAGLNGTFFANASLNGTDNLLIGPSLCGNEAQIQVGPYDKKDVLAGRPLVLMSEKTTRIIPYDPLTMDEESALRSQMPAVKDAFLGGVWLVHNSVAVTKDDIGRFNVHDADDPRRRAFFALLPDGRPVLGATTYVATSSQLARALQDEGIQEAVLLDSGFSTSLVRGKDILVTGHTAPGIPSRPVPHALVLFDPAGTKLTQNIPDTKTSTE